MRSIQATPQPEMHHLLRLPSECYRGFAAVHWTLTFQHKKSGWLDDLFHHHFRELLLHASAQQGLFCSTYVLLPDHIHLLWLGLRTSTDQKNAMHFLRKHLADELDRRSSKGDKYKLQKQSHDNVLREKDRTRGALAKVCFYILDNPRRRELVEHPRAWPHLGAVVPGYPTLHPLDDGFWELFWRIYSEQREEAPITS